MSAPPHHAASCPRATRPHRAPPTRAAHRRAAKVLDKTLQLHGLSSRAVNALGRHSIRTREEARERNILAILPSERNCGSKTVNEIERWLTSECN